MCGIFGVVFAGSDRKDSVAAAVASLHHRGPDAHAIEGGDGYVFGHTRLAVIDLSPGGAQPMMSDDRRTILVFNGEIYNHHDLRTELAGRGFVFRSRSDTEVILHGYRAWGADVVSRLDGMFAIGIFDVGAQSLLLARDRTGKKPVFYRFDGGELSFASEPKALIAPGTKPEVDANSLPMLLSLGYVPAPWSPFRGIAQLPPASLLVLARGAPEPRIQRYWSPRFSARPRRTTVHAAASEVRELVIRAVKRRLEADVPLGAFLSGGLDSTIVVGVMARLLGRNVKTFSLGFSGDARYDETAYARQVAATFETQHEEFIVESTLSPDTLDDLVRAHDAPFGDSSAIPMSIVSRLARRHVTVALTGDGGDDVFCGYDRFLVAEALERLPPGVARFTRKAPGFLPRSASERSTLNRVRRLLPTMGAPLAQRLVDLYPYFGADPSRVLRSELLPIARGARAWTEDVLGRSQGSSPLSRVLDHSFETYLPYDLLVKADRSSMMHGLELRSPFLDTALIDYGSALPDGCRRHFSMKKYVLRLAFADIVPETVLRRPKMGFGIPLAAWFRTSTRSLARDRLGSSARLYQYIDPAFVSALLDEHEQSLEDHSHRIWLLLTLETWLDQLRA
ncbi:MAG TPA: asparagine synthase (glutamine-hydrolyzing) [Polyangiaceae bacterium]|nr:asparagine synthase (glutamine-hydrolyzing) [Polyangiaceae bacterium]